MGGYCSRIVVHRPKSPTSPSIWRTHCWRPVLWITFCACGICTQPGRLPFYAVTPVWSHRWISVRRPVTSSSIWSQRVQMVRWRFGSTRHLAMAKRLSRKFFDSFFCFCMVPNSLARSNFLPFPLQLQAESISWEITSRSSANDFCIIFTGRSIFSCRFSRSSRSRLSDVRGRTEAYSRNGSAQRHCRLNSVGAQWLAIHFGQQRWIGARLAFWISTMEILAFANVWTIA